MNGNKVFLFQFALNAFDPGNIDRSHLFNIDMPVLIEAVLFGWGKINHKRPFFVSWEQGGNNQGAGMFIHHIRLQNDARAFLFGFRPFGRLQINPSDF